MSTQPVLGLLYLFNRLRADGVDLEPLLARHGLTVQQLAPGGRISRALELRLLCALVDELPEQAHGLHLGQSFGFTGYGAFSFLLLTSTTAYEALQCGLRYQQLTFLLSPLRFVPGEGESALCLDSLELPGRARRFLLDLELVGTYQLLRDLQSNLRLNPRALRVDIPYPEPPELAAYAAYYDCPVNFGSDSARIWISNEYLQQRLPTADAMAHALYQNQCDELLSKRQQADEPSDWPAQVRQHLALFAQGFPSAQQVAQALGVAERTLRHHLNARGCNFRQLLEEARGAKAKELLSDSRYSIEQIALQLGYAESAAFIHAFARWAGQSPAAWRRALSRQIAD